MRQQHPLFVCLALLVCLPVQAEVFKWVDANGKVQYSDQPPNLDAKGKPLKVQNTQGAEEVSRKTLEERANKAKQDEQSKQAADARAQACKTARSNLTALQSAGPVLVKNDKGADVELSKAEREKELERTKDLIQRSCSS